MTSKPLTIAIDGPAGSGKSSTAKKVAEELNYLYLDSGAMYRAVTLAVLKQDVDPKDEETVIQIAKECEIDFTHDKSGQRVMLNGTDATEAIRTPEVTNAIAPVAANPDVREILVEKQRALGERGGIVAEGRDIGTVVFPNAELKIYMVASIRERAKRRLKELQEKNIKVDLEQLEKEIRQRDTTDSQRQHGALIQAPDAVVVNTTKLSLPEQVEFILNKARERGA